MTERRVIHDQSGRPGVIESDADNRVRIRLPDGAALDVPSSMVSVGPDGSALAAVVFGDLDPGPSDRIIEAEEQIDVSTRVRETARVIARTVTDTHNEPIEADGWRETVNIERVSIGREVDSVEDVRIEDGVTIVPVYEEVLVVQKQLVLREEIRLRTHREVVSGLSHIPLRTQRVEVERLPPSDAASVDG